MGYELMQLKAMAKGTTNGKKYLGRHKTAMMKSPNRVVNKQEARTARWTTQGKGTCYKRLKQPVVEMNVM